MPSFTFDPTIPIGTHYPGNDRPLMQTNFNSTQGILNVDHYSFDNTTNGGWHKQVSFPVSNVPVSDPTGTAAVMYTANGSASTAGISQVYFKNSQAPFLLNCIKAFGSFMTLGTTGPGNTTILNGYNINATVVKPSPPSAYQVTLNSNVVTGNNVVVFIQPSSTDSIGYSFSAGVLSINTQATSILINFMILQA